MLLDLGEHMQGQIFWHGSYSREIIFLLKRILRPGMVFIDCGANVGEVSLVAAKLVGATGRVLAFEPVDRFANQLERNVRANRLDWIEICRCGLSERRGQAVIYTADVVYSDGTQHDGLGTLYPSPGRTHPEQAVPLETLDAALSGRGLTADVIKLDIEGGELAALKGAGETLSKGPDLIIEIGEATCRAAGYRGSDILSFLEPFGYRFHRIGRKGKLAPITAQGLADFQNVFCSTKRQLPS